MLNKLCALPGQGWFTLHASRVTSLPLHVDVRYVVTQEPTSDPQPRPLALCHNAQIVFEK